MRIFVWKQRNTKSKFENGTKNSEAGMNRIEVLTQTLNMYEDLVGKARNYWKLRYLKET